MLIQNESSTNELFANGALNPAFFGVTALPSQSKTVAVTPAPVKTTVTVTPPPVVQDGITVTFPPYQQEITLQPPSINVQIPSTGGGLKNTFESVGVINPSGQIRLCALVRPNVIAAAHHYNNAPFQSYIGMQVIFGNGETATITDVVLTRDDFECYSLDRNITSVQPAAIAPLEPSPNYTDREVIIFGLLGLKKAAAGRTRLKYAFGNGAIWSAQASNKINQPVVVEKGDSGSPVFITVAGAVRYFGSLASVNPSLITINVAAAYAADISSL